MVGPSRATWARWSRNPAGRILHCALGRQRQRQRQRQRRHWRARAARNGAIIRGGGGGVRPCMCVHLFVPHRRRIAAIRWPRRPFVQSALPLLARFLPAKDAHTHWAAAGRASDANWARRATNREPKIVSVCRHISRAATCRKLQLQVPVSKCRLVAFWPVRRAMASLQCMCALVRRSWSGKATIARPAEWGACFVYLCTSSGPVSGAGGRQLRLAAERTAQSGHVA